MRLRSPAAAGAVAALLAGCGGTTPPSLVQLRARANPICARAGQRLARVDTPGSEAGGQAFLKHGIAVLEPELGQLRTVPAPSEAADVYRAGLAALTAELRALEDAVRALNRQQDPVIEFKTLQQRLGPLETQANHAWQALQLPACLQG